MATLTVATTTGSGTNQTQKNYSGADAGRYFNAWQVCAGPRDVNGQPNGTQKDFTRWCADLIQKKLEEFVIQNEYTPVAVPPVTTTDS